MFSFASPESPGGLYVNLGSFQARVCAPVGAVASQAEGAARSPRAQAFAESFVELDHSRTGQALYLHVRWTRVAREAAACDAAPPTRLALGLPGGFALADAPQHDTLKQHSLVHLPSRMTVPFPCVELPLGVTLAVEALLSHADAATSEQVSAWEDARTVSRHAAGLLQEDACGRRVPPDAALWRDAETGATENLWLNLSDGYIGGGRRNWDGSGGSGSALRHFEAMRAQGKFYPLAVKLGTITPRGADVYSYAPDEDDMVENPQLAQHLAHWGIDVLKSEKTEKSMAELEVHLNSSYEFDKITESGAALVPLSGPGYTGLGNLGNSCYMNSLLQLLKELPQFGRHYQAMAQRGCVFAAAPAASADDLRVQAAKLAHGLLAGGEPSVKPARFKALVGRGHPEFSSSRQQDVVEYLLHLLSKLDALASPAPANADQPAIEPLSALFQFQVQHRDACAASGAVRYSLQRESVLMLPIPEEAASNVSDVARYKERQAKRQKLRSAGASAYICAPGGDNEGLGHASSAMESDGSEEAPVRPQVPFSACLSRYEASEALTGLALGGGARGPGVRTTRLASCPRYLALQMGRFTVGANWVPQKMDVLVTPPMRLDITALKAQPRTQGETLLPDDDVASGAASAPPNAAAAAAAAAECPLQADEGIVASLVSMGFSENGSRRAALATRNAGAEASMDWVLAHLEDADFNEPLPASAPASAPAPAPVDPEKLSQLTGMGFSARAASAALRASHGALERAADWLFTQPDAEAAAAALEDEEAHVASHSAQPPPAAAPSQQPGHASAEPPLDDGPPLYSLIGFVSHMGANTTCGHYVAHVLREGRWVLYNDEKVALSASPPLDIGYLYLYKRDE